MLINSGSCFEYGKSTGKLSEKEGCRPASIYGTFKCLSTNLVSQFSSISKIRTITLRIFQAYGPYEVKGRLVPYVLYSLIKGERISLKTPNLKRDFVFTEDVTRAFEQSIEIVEDLDQNEIINIGTGDSTSIVNLVRIAKNVTRSGSTIDYGNHAEKPEDDLGKLEADITKAQRVIGWSPRYGLKDGLRIYSEWMKDRLEFYRTQR